MYLRNDNIKYGRDNYRETMKDLHSYFDLTGNHWPPYNEEYAIKVGYDNMEAWHMALKQAIKEAKGEKK
ncbi:MAG: hypothetical protein LBT60_01765 [Oscillospiraceae bacterium]|nr:hypothetical protein [Oscillospiraceae bacterium]